MKNFIKIVAMAIIIFATSVGTLVSRDIKLTTIPTIAMPGSNMLIMPASGNDFKHRLDSFKLDGVNSLNIILSKTKDYISIAVPKSIAIGPHKIAVYLNDVLGEDIVIGEFSFDVIANKENTELYPKGADPNPNTQNGKPKDLGKDPQPVPSNETINNPSGGWGNAGVDCSKLHIIDGKFTDTLPNNGKEWSGINPLSGRFSNLYLDYCTTGGTLYLMNDWYNGTGKYDSSSCYNRFEFKTGNGYESWVIKVFHSEKKPIEVFKNGYDVTKDTNIVVGGRFGTGKSPLVDSLHTLYEFGVKASSGMFVMEQQHDPYSPPEGPSITVICDKDGVVGYGLVAEPSRTVGNLESGFSGKREGRYIPIEGVAGLEVEPNTIGGVIRKDSISVSLAGANGAFTPCDKNHKVDGKFTDEVNFKEEWLKSNPAVGKFSNLYADYCSGWLYVLNDWKLANQEPDSKNCYNLFELYTSGGAEHWGVYVYQDPNRKTKVFRNGKDVSGDTTIVKPGFYGFSKSPLDTNPHAIYEFAIKANEGAWALYMADPGPASFCDEDDSPAPRPFACGVGVRKDDCYICGYPGEHTSLILSNPGDTLGLTFGTNIDSKEWWCRNFTIEIPFNPNVFTPISVNKTSKNQISYDKVDYSITTNAQNQKIIKISGTNNDYIKNTGDIFTLEGITTFATESAFKLTPKLYISNATNVMRSSDLTAVQIEKKATGINNEISDYYSVYPNPIVDNTKLKIAFNSEVSENIVLKIVDVNGKVITTMNQQVTSVGKNVIELNTNDLATGFYFVQISSGNFIRTFSIRVAR